MRYTHFIHSRAFALRVLTVGLLLRLQVVPKPVAKLAIPGLKLTGADTKDGSSAVGKGTVLTMKATSSSDSSSEAESEDDAPPVRYPLVHLPLRSSCSSLTHAPHHSRWWPRLRSRA
jgi:hypothetical protein